MVQLLLTHFMEPTRPYKEIEFSCGCCSFKFKATSLFEGYCPRCGVYHKEPGTGKEYTCGSCEHFRHYPHCCTLHGDKHPNGITPPSWTLAACNDYKKRR